VQINRLLSTIVITSLVACGSNQSTVEPAMTPSVEAPDGCQVLLVIETDSANGQLAGQVTLLARAKNLTSGSLELTLQGRCPGGDAWFSGLDPEYDWYHTCTMGMCADGQPTKVIALPPGGAIDIASTQIDADGRQSCNRPIAAGTHELSFSLVFPEGASNPTVCGPEPLVLHRK
jgi:hypothetical protein